MRKLALGMALVLLSGLALLVFLTTPGVAQDGRIRSDARVPAPEAPPVRQGDPPLAAVLDTTLVFQQSVSPTVSYEGVVDTYIFIDTPQRTPGEEALLKLYHDHRQKILLRFELADHIPVGSVVTAARLELRTFQRTTAERTDVGLYQLLRPWTEDDASWNNAAPGEPWQVAGCGPGTDRASEYAALATFTHGNTWYSWESLQFTALVQEWVSDPTSNHGVILIGLSVHDRQFWSLFSSQYGTSPDGRLWRPKLVVSYQPALPTATPTLSMTPSPVRTPSPTPTGGAPQGSVAGMAWQDANQNSTHDLNELPMPGVPVVLSRYADNQEVGRHITAADGSYEFTGVSADSYVLTTETLPGYGCSYPLGGVWVFPLSTGQALTGLHFGLYQVATITPTRTPQPTPTRTLQATPTRTSPGATVTGTRTPTVGLTQTPTGISTPSVTPTRTATFTPTASPTPTATTGPSPTPTSTPAGTLGDPIRVSCEQSYTGTTAGRPALIQNYGECFGGLFGPEVVYALEVSYPMDFLSISLDTVADLTLFVLGSANPADCRSWGGIVGLSSVSPGTYYIVVDGFGSGSYDVEIRCFPPPEVTPTPTGTRTVGPSPTPTSTRVPGAVQLYLPVVRRAYPIEFFVNCGADVNMADSLGRHWLADQEHSPGSWGYVGDPLVWSTKRAILDADDPLVYQTQRFGDGGSFGYRFDVPNATYEVELRFAEIYAPIDEPRKRVFDVQLEGQTVLDNFDVVGEAAGQFRALTRSFTVEVSDEQLNITFARDWTEGVDNPIINAIRVTKID